MLLHDTHRSCQTFPRSPRLQTAYNNSNEKLSPLRPEFACDCSSAGSRCLHARVVRGGVGVMLDATNGNLLGTFPSFLLAPAFSGSMGYFVGRATLTARDATSLLSKWTFNGDSGIVTAPGVAQHASGTVC